LTLPSVRCGKVWREETRVSYVYPSLFASRIESFSGTFVWHVSNGLVGLCLSTFAISLQLFPASLIVLSRCSSAGVHGVLVLLFFTLGSCGGASVLAAAGAAGALDAAAPAEGVVPDISCAIDLRFLELPGEVGWANAVAGEASVPADVLGGWAVAESDVVKVKWAVVVGAIGDGFRLRLGA
jgi:hypothetical protein